MVPTTAGSGAEVFQFTLVVDEEKAAKLVAGGPQCFPDLALLDPAVLEDIPARLAVISAVDALSHAVEAMFATLATPLTDGLALTAISELVRCLESGGTGDELRERKPLAASMANMACGNARLGLVHAASLPLEAHCGMVHRVGVGVLLPRVLLFNTPAAPSKVEAIADRLGIKHGPTDAAERVADRLFALYRHIGFPTHFDEGSSLSGREVEMARLALPCLYGGAVSFKDDTAATVNSPNIRPARVQDVAALYELCQVRQSA